MVSKLQILKLRMHCRFDTVVKKYTEEEGSKALRYLNAFPVQSNVFLEVVGSKCDVVTGYIIGRAGWVVPRKSLRDVYVRNIN